MGLQESGWGNKNGSTEEVRKLMGEVENLKNQVEQLQKAALQQDAKKQKKINKEIIKGHR